MDGAAFSESSSSVASRAADQNATPQSRSVVDVDDELDDAAAVAGHEFVEHYNAHRPHRSLRQRPPAGRTPPPSCATDRPLRRDRLGGLIHEYVQVACVTGFSAPTRLLRTGLAEIHGPPVPTKLRAATTAYEKAIWTSPEPPDSPPEPPHQT